MLLIMTKSRGFCRNRFARYPPSCSRCLRKHRRTSSMGRAVARGLLPKGFAEHSSFQALTQPQTPQACTLWESINYTMTYFILQFSPERNHSRSRYIPTGVYRPWSSRTEISFRYCSGARILLLRPPAQLVALLEGPAPEETAPRVSRELLGARAPCTRCEMGADSSPLPEDLSLL